MGETYAGAGVDIGAGEEAVERIKAAVRSTFRPEVIGDVGGFGGLFAFDPTRYVHPVLVAGTDGVGTKAVVARLAGRFDTIGIDLVAMSVDDIAAQGAEPLFFLDCISAGRLDPEQMEQLVAGVASGCREAGCALIGGEMAELPGMLEPGHFDLVGFAVGVVERDRLITGAGITPGDRLIGLPSPGLRCNGYSLARRVLLDVARRPLDGPAWPRSHHSLGEELLRPSVIYAPALVNLCRSVEVKGLAHITGGGIPGNLARVLPDDCDAVVVTSKWEVPEIFNQIQAAGDIRADEMTRVFNLGIGMIAVVAPRDVYRAHDLLRDAGHDSVDIGEIVQGEGQVRLKF
ncbi:MAG TPA: phosphoribosylformylglycinamidine cyclo-ligase [Acidimicrobiales bacterium]|nr:phosphoribosylformylglycinamidine cyclo-ligase [Acidimicrobiales bacterium]